MAGSLSIVHMDTLSSAYLPVLRSTKIVKKISYFSYTLQSNYAGVKQLGTEGTAAVNDNIFLSAANVSQGRYAAKVKDDCGKVLLSANSVTLQGFVGMGSPVVKQVCYVYDGNNHLLINGSGIKAGNQSQMAFIKVPGTEQQYYLFTIGSDKLPYVHTIDIAQRKVISKNALLDNTVGYGFTMKVLEDLVGTGNSQLYLRRIKSTKDSAYIMSFEITSGGIGSGKILARFASKDINGVGEIDLNPDATKMLVANTKGGPAIWWWHSSIKVGELKLFTLNAAHTAVTVTSSVTLGSYSSARSVAFNADGTNIYYNKYYNGVNSLRKYSSTFTSPVTVVSSQASGDIRRGNNNNLFSPKSGTRFIYSVTDGTTPGVNSPLSALLGTVFTGGLQMNKHVISHGLNCTSNGFFARNLLHKSYELKDHLGNVRVVISDMKNWVDGNTNNIPDGGEFIADTKVYNNYFAFGSPQPGRTYNQYTGAAGYRYSFNGKENDPEVIGTAGGTQDYGFRIYNPSLGKFLSTDPLQKDYPELTPYQFASNSPIEGIDLDGLENQSYLFKETDKGMTKLSVVDYSETEKKHGPMGDGVEVKYILKNGNIVHTFGYHDKNEIIKTKVHIVGLREQINGLKTANKLLKEKIAIIDKKYARLEEQYENVETYWRSDGTDPHSGIDMARLYKQSSIGLEERALNAEKEKANSEIKLNNDIIKTLKNAAKVLDKPKAEPVAVPIPSDKL